MSTAFVNVEFSNQFKIMLPNLPKEVLIVPSFGFNERFSVIVASAPLSNPATMIRHAHPKQMHRVARSGPERSSSSIFGRDGRKFLWNNEALNTVASPMAGGPGPQVEILLLFNAFMPLHGIRELLRRNTASKKHKTNGVRHTVRSPIPKSRPQESKNVSTWAIKREIVL